MTTTFLVCICQDDDQPSSIMLQNYCIKRNGSNNYPVNWATWKHRTNGVSLFTLLHNNRAASTELVFRSAFHDNYRFFKRSVLNFMRFFQIHFFPRCSSHSKTFYCPFLIKHCLKLGEQSCKVSTKF